MRLWSSAGWRARFIDSEWRPSPSPISVNKTFIFRGIRWMLRSKFAILRELSAESSCQRGYGRFCPHSCGSNTVHWLLDADATIGQSWMGQAGATGGKISLEPWCAFCGNYRQTAGGIFLTAGGKRSRILAGLRPGLPKALDWMFSTGWRPHNPQESVFCD